MGAGHDKAGQGASAFRAYLRALPDDIAAARDAGLPVVLERTSPLAPHAQRLMDALGVEVRIVTQPVSARQMGSYLVTGEREPFVENTIDYRHSVVQANKRADAGDETLEICPHCMCEVDVDPQPHRPGCAGIGAPRTTSVAVLPRTVERREDSSSERAVDPEPEEGPRSPTPDAGGLDAQQPPMGARTAEATDATGEPEPRPAPNGAPTVWDRDSIIAAIVDWNAEHGKPPTRRDWMRQGDGYPSAYAVNVVFSTWAAGIEAAGFPRPTRGSRAGAVRVSRPPVEVQEREDATPEERAAGAVADPSAAARSSSAAPEDASALTFGLTLEQLSAAGHALDAIAAQLAHLEKPDRRAVWEFIGPLVEAALEC